MTPEALAVFHKVLDVILVLCTFYQVVFFAAGLFLKKKEPKSGRLHRFAVMIAARNEEEVIARLVGDLKNQTYPKGYLDIYVMSDRSEDHTAEEARKAGAYVFERRTLVGRGKGYVLHELWEKIRETGKRYDGYFVFDADNRVSRDFVEKMNAVFSSGHPIVTGKRQSTNFGAGWIADGYALWFLRDGILNRARTAFRSSCPVTGTGFLVASSILEESGGWQYFSLTEDSEFSADALLRGYKAAYADEAVFFDEQPTDFKTSWRQRMRWSKGYMEVFCRYGARLFAGIFKKGGLAAYDACMNLLPAVACTAISVMADAVSFVLRSSAAPLAYLFHTLLGAWVTVFFFGLATAIKERKALGVTYPRLLKAAVTLPIFMMTYLPIAVAAVFSKVEWTPIRHTGKSIPEQMK